MKTTVTETIAEYINLDCVPLPIAIKDLTVFQEQYKDKYKLIYPNIVYDNYNVVHISLVGERDMTPAELEKEQQRQQKLKQQNIEFYKTQLKKLEEENV